MDTYTLPNIQRLNLSGNNIGREGCRTILNLLSNFDYLDLSDTDMGDEEFQLLATSLENNTKLRTFDLRGNDIAERGYKAFLKLIFDVSSIENMYKSNHTLRALYLPVCSSGQEFKHITDSIFDINSNSSHAAGRAKVIKYQLNSKERKKMCRLQGVEYTSINLFPDIEPNLLPRILVLIGREYGQGEFYSALISMVPDLMSYVDTSGMIKDEMARNSAQAAALIQQASKFIAKNDQLSRRLAERESGDN